MEHKIISIEKGKQFEYIETTISIFRRFDQDNYEVLMGESWEPVYYPEGIEEVYREYKERT